MNRNDPAKMPDSLQVLMNIIEHLLHEEKSGSSEAFQYINEQTRDWETQVSAMGSALRETAKWIIGGLAVATGGVVAGTSLISLGEPEVGWRLLFAILAFAIGLLGLGLLFGVALKVIVPP